MCGLTYFPDNNVDSQYGLLFVSIILKKFFIEKNN